jgi:hypothetical protein
MFRPPGRTVGGRASAKIKQKTAQPWQGGWKKDKSQRIHKSADVDGSFCGPMIVKLPRFSPSFNKLKTCSIISS